VRACAAGGGGGWFAGGSAGWVACVQMQRVLRTGAVLVNHLKTPPLLSLCLSTPPPHTHIHAHTHAHNPPYHPPTRALALYEERKEQVNSAKSDINRARDELTRISEQLAVEVERRNKLQTDLDKWVALGWRGAGEVRGCLVGLGWTGGGSRI